MAQKVTFDFKEKEGKFFSPLVGRAEKKTIDSEGTITTKMVPKAGLKGIYAKVRMSLTPENITDKRELFAVNTEMFISSR